MEVLKGDGAPSRADVLEAFRHQFRSREWPEQASDAEIAEILHWHDFDGGTAGPGRPATHLKMSDASWRFWVHWTNFNPSVREKPVLSGRQQFVACAREAFGIRPPGSMQPELPLAPVEFDVTFSWERPTGNTVDQRQREWSGLVTSAWRAGVQAIVTVGQILLEAKADIPEGHWQGWIEHDTPISERTARQLMQIACDPNILRFINESTGAMAPVLPDDRRVLAEICGQDEADFNDLVSHGVIHAEMRRGDLKRWLVAQEHGGAREAPTLPQGDTRYGAILADPPWPFATYGAGNTRAPDQHYPTMPLDEICALPVAALAADDCALFLWVPSHLLHGAPHVMRCWGFHFVTSAFVWVKDGIGMGYWTRKQTELCLLGTRGAPKRQAADVGELIRAPRGRHSEKPGDAHGRIERLVAGPYLELFARQQRPGWDAWGNDPALNQPGSSS